MSVTVKEKNKIKKKIKQIKRAYYILDIKETPGHIKHRYYAHFNDEGKVEKVGLEWVTQIDGEYIGFKDIFSVNMGSLDSQNPQIKEHVDLFLELISLKPEGLILE